MDLSLGNTWAWCSGLPPVAGSCMLRLAPLCCPGERAVPPIATHTMFAASWQRMCETPPRGLGSGRKGAACQSRRQLHHLGNNCNSKIDGNWFSEMMRLKATICGGTILGKPWNLVSLPNPLRQILLLSSFREKEDTREVINLLRFGQ